MNGPRIRARKLNGWELGAAAAVMLLGAFTAAKGLDYSVGQLNRIGPGFFPLAVGILLMLLAAGIMVEVRFSDTPAPTIPLRPMAAITFGLVAFGLLIESAGLVPATFALVVLSAAGDRTMTPVRAVVVAAGLSALGWAVFILGFHLPIDAFWW